jgi:hypothetical protein
MRRLNAFITQLRTTALGPLTLVRSRDLPPTPDESESIVNAFNQLEQHLDGLRDAGHRLALVSASLRSSAREMKDTADRLTPPRSHAAIPQEPVPETAVPSIPADERKAHLRLLKTVA